MCCNEVLCLAKNEREILSMIENRILEECVEENRQISVKKQDLMQTCMTRHKQHGVFQI